MAAFTSDYDRTRCLRRIGALELERSTWWDHWREINSVLLPRTGQFFLTDTNKGNRRNQNIIDNTATKALRTLGAGMQSGMTNPSQPWVRLEAADEDLMENAAVSRWCDQVSKIILTIFQRSNTYRALHSIYEELGAYGTAACIVLPDFENVIHCYPLTIGEYCISADDRGNINTLSREFEMTVQQIVERFVFKNRPREQADWSNVSSQVKNLWDSGNLDAWIPLYQLIEPRRSRDVTKRDAKNMPFVSVIFEKGGNENKLLSESGYRRFPVLVPRWSTSGQDIYGSTSPGMEALGDINQLQHDQYRKSQGIDYMVKPPLQVPTMLKNQDSDFLPGGVTYYDAAAGAGAKVQSAFDVRIDMSHLLLDIQDVRTRINGAMFTDLFLFLSQLDAQRGQRTAREIAEIHEEKLLQLGPVAERQQNELLTPLVDIAFDAAMEAGILPPPPPELEDQDLSIKFLSVFAQAQRSVSMSGIDRMIGAVASIAAAKQDMSVWDNINTDRTIEKAANYLSVDAEIVNSKDEKDAIRQARAEQQAAAAKLAMAKEASETAKNLGAADMSGNTALSAVAQSAPAFTGI